MSFDLNCFLQELHCLNEPSLIKGVEISQGQKIHLEENLVNNPLLLIYPLND
jgi:hypothetical protein